MKRFLLAFLAVIIFVPIFDFVIRFLPEGSADNAQAIGGLLTIVIFVVVFRKLKKNNGTKKQTKFYGKSKALFDLLQKNIFSSDITTLQEQINTFAKTNNVDNSKVQHVVKSSITPIAEYALADGVLSHEEEEAIEALLNAYNLGTSDLDEAGRRLLMQGAIIRDLLNGEVKPRIEAENIPYKLQKDEVPVWGYNNMPISEIRKVSKFKGGSQGVSVRVAKGLYWRVGKMAAQRVSSTETRQLGQGNVFITSHHLFYTVGAETKRIKHNKVFSIEPYADGVVVHIDAASAKPLIFKTIDTWFFANILQNAQNWA